MTILTLNCFEIIKMYSHFVSYVRFCSTEDQITNRATPYCQYHACWCPGDLRSQGISRHDTDPQSQNILSPASEELKPMIPKSLQITSMISAAKLLWIYQNTWHRSPKKLSLSLNNIILTLFNFSFTSELEVKKDCKCTQNQNMIKSWWDICKAPEI